MKWISYYFSPHNLLPKMYLVRDSDGEGWHYTKHIAEAHLFDTEEEALAQTPVYDGTDQKVGVECV